jgi:predicted flap endonuclease-1-like 5' DNA nuclease
MPEITIVTIAIIAAALIVGMTIGWIVRGNRSKSEKAAINSGWQEQLEAHRSEHQRLVEQNKTLMEQNSQYQASNKDAKLRAGELSEALKEAFARRDDLQRQIKDIRSNLEIAVSERKQLQQDMQSRTSKDESLSATLRERDSKILKLSRELDNWQDRLPPLIERYRRRNEEAERLELELETAHQRIQALESMVGSDETRVEPVGPGSLQDGLDASNEPMGASQTSGELEVGMQDRDVAADDPEQELSWGEVVAAAVAGEGQTDDERAGDEFAAAGVAVEEPAGVAPAAFGEDEDDKDADEDAAQDENDEADNGEEEDAAIPEASGAFDDDVFARSTGDDDFAASLARDDLKMIKGVGPAIEKTLNEMGIFRFDQIAGMSEYDIDRVANRLKGFRSRIYREDWIGQARELQDRKASGQS